LPPTFSPKKSESIGVNTTDVCVKKEARDASVKISPAFCRPCAPAFHHDSSRAARNKLAPLPLLSSSVVGFFMMVGTKQAAAMIPRTKLAIEGAGGPSVPYSSRNETVSEPYSAATISN
jgi:hypothetical protein